MMSPLARGDAVVFVDGFGVVLGANVDHDIALVQMQNGSQHEVRIAIATFAREFLSNQFADPFRIAKAK